MADVDVHVIYQTERKIAVYKRERQSWFEREVAEKGGPSKESVPAYEVIIGTGDIYVRLNSGESMLVKVLGYKVS